MALGIDATILYHLGSWTATIHQSDLDRPRAVQHAHPQGAAADADLQSRAWPRCRRPPTRTHVDYLYYVAIPGKAAQYFTSSYQDFLAHGG